MKNYLIMLAVAFFAICGCEKENRESEVVGSVKLSTNVILSGAEGGDFDVTVTSSDDWRISGLCDWVVPDKESGRSGEKITFKISPSSSVTADSTYYKVFAGSAVEKIMVKIVAGKVIELESDSMVEVSPDMCSFSVNMKTNIEDLSFDYTNDGSKWISFDKRADAFGTTRLFFNVNRSNEFKARESDVLIKGATSGDVAIRVRQPQRDTILCDTPSLVKGLDADDNIELVVRANVLPVLTFESDWLTKVSESKGAEAVDGLTPYTFVFSAPKASMSRITTLYCHNGSESGPVVRRLSIKQQSPNPILTNITDAKLRAELSNLGWLVSGDADSECEVVGDGLTATSLSLVGDEWTVYEFSVIDGLGGFPKLESVNIEYSNAKTIDLSDSKTITSFNIANFEQLEDVRLGDCPLETFSLGSNPMFTGLKSKSGVLNISGNKVRNFILTCTSWYIAFGEEKCKILDVTGCPLLSDLQAKREYVRGNTTKCILETIYVTAAQKAAVDAGTLTVEKSDLTSIEVK